jgi:hypothetical protein
MTVKLWRTTDAAGAQDFSGFGISTAEYRSSNAGLSKALRWTTRRTALLVPV